MCAGSTRKLVTDGRKDSGEKDMISTRAIDCAHMRLFCMVCNRRFSIRNISTCPECSLWRQVCQTCGNLEDCSTLQGCIPRFVSAQE
jgi:hypothetical protein